jgi:hypothetical protein
MKVTGSLLLTFLFCLLPPLSAQQTSPNGPTSTNPQDVPQQQTPPTQSPDVMKQRRPAPDSSQGNTGDASSKDVPHQEPGTNNPDVGKQRHDDKMGPKGVSGATGQQGSSKKKSKSHKQNSNSSQTSSTASH